MLSLVQSLAHVAGIRSINDAVVAAAVTSFICYLVYLRFTADAIPTYSLYLPFLTQWNFFAKRSDLLSDAFSKFHGSAFRLKIIGYPVIVTRSQPARAYFFGDKKLSFSEGYKILLGGAPRLEDIRVETENVGKDISWFQNRITHLLRKERLTDLLPKLISDMDSSIGQWGREGVMDPFKDIYDVIFQLTARAALCNEIADDPVKTSRVRVLYEKIERAADAKSHVFPWLPNSATRVKNSATKELYDLLSDIVKTKKERGSTELDSVQAMIEIGDGTPDIVGFALGTLFAGVLNTTNVACWIPLFLDANPRWKARVATEIKAFLGKNSQEGETISSRMLAVSPSAWEDELPVIDLVIRETIRLVVTGAAMRRNVDKAVVVDGKVIEKGAFLLYPLAELHFDPDIYTDPYDFDPSRFEDGREEDRKVQFGYLGWGVGRHPCLGMRFAKLELKMLTVYLLACFEFLHVDQAGNRRKADGHSVDRNQVFQVFPLDKETFLKYRRIVA